MRQWSPGSGVKAATRRRPDHRSGAQPLEPRLGRVRHSLISNVSLFCILFQSYLKKSHTCELSDAGCATALVGSLMSHTITPPWSSACDCMFVNSASWSVVTRGSAGFSGLTTDWLTQPRQGTNWGPTNPFLGAVRHRSKRWMAKTLTTYYY